MNGESPTTRTVLAVVVAASLVLAGCSGGGATPNATNDSTGTTANATPTGTGGATATASATATAPATATPTTTAAPTSTPGEGSPEAQSALSRAASAVEDPVAYRLVTEQTVRTSGPVSRTQERTRRTTVNRTAREVERHVTVSVAGRTRNVTAYVVDETLYLKSKVYLRQYSSKWVKSNVSENFSRIWRYQDPLSRQRLLFGNATAATVAGTETVDGVETKVVRFRVPNESYERILTRQQSSAPTTGDLNVTAHVAEFTVRLSTDTGRPVSMESHVEYTLTLRGRSITQNVTSTYDYEYGVAGSITLPDAASTAVSLGDDGNQSRVVPPRAPSTNRVALP